ncbi:MAG: crotonase/enoyl-CoA hydratase family protein [Rhodobacteraceae bacterium]|nr:crotonase/enoyl-CoA hydratase family protein [Paracoccaceae bacterium]
MMETIAIKIDGRGVATLLLNRPEKHNVLSAVMIAELTQAAADLGADSAVRVVVLTGAGKSFCAGGDLEWMRAQMLADRAQRMREARKLAEMLQALNTMPKPLIGKINGQAYGGGVGLMSVCDVAISDENARFGLTETMLGLIPATISPYVVARMGERFARRVMMSGRRFGAAEAKEMGLISRFVMAEYLDKAVEVEVAPYLKAAPQAVAATKALIRRLGVVIDDAVIDMTIEALADTWEGAEAAEGVAAFFEKRKAVW